jgi:hypothetical protein
MASTYSPNLRVELIGTGDQAGTWGSTTNNNLGTLLENAVSGYVSVSVTSANQALTALNGANDQSRNAVLALTTTTGADFAVYAPPAPKTYVITNSSAYTASVYNSTVLGNTTAAGTGVAVPAGKTVSIWSDGTNMAVQIDHLSTLSLASDLAVVDGGTGASDAPTARTNLGVQALAAGLTDIAGLAVTDGNVIVGDGTNWVAESGATARTSLGLAIGTDVQAYDVDTAKTDVAQTFTASQRGTVTTDDDLSFDLSATNNFFCTPAGTGTLTFTNHTAGQSGFILLDNSGGHSITAAGTTKINAEDLTAISTAGVYVIAYFDNGTNTYIMVSRSFA